MLSTFWLFELICWLDLIRISDSCEIKVTLYLNKGLCQLFGYGLNGNGQWSFTLKINKTTYNWEWFEKCQSICKTWPSSFIHLLSFPILYKRWSTLVILAHGDIQSKIAQWLIGSFCTRYVEVTHPSPQKVLPPTDKVPSCSSYAQTVRRQLGTSGLGRSIHLQQSGWETLLTTLTQQIDTIGQGVANTVPMGLLGAICESWM